MIPMGTVTFVGAAVVGLITFIVYMRVMRMCPPLNSPILSLCVGMLTFLALTDLGGGWFGGILIGYGALGLSVVLLILLSPFLKGKEKLRKKKMWPAQEQASLDEEKEDPWEKEMRLRTLSGKQRTFSGKTK